MKHCIIAADSKKFLVPHKCAVCGKSINIFAKALCCANPGCHLKLHEKCYKKNPNLPEDCKGNPLASGLPSTTTPHNALPAPTTTTTNNNTTNTTTNTTNTLTTPPPGAMTMSVDSGSPSPSHSSPSRPSSSSSAHPPVHAASAPAGNTAPGVTVTAPPSAFPQQGYPQPPPQQQAPGVTVTAPPPAFPQQGYPQPPPPQQGYPSPYGTPGYPQPQQYQQHHQHQQYQPYQQQQYQQYQQPYQDSPPNPYQGAHQSPQGYSPQQQQPPVDMMASMNLTDEPHHPSYQGAVFNQVMYNGAPLNITNPWYTQQQQHAPWLSTQQQQQPQQRGYGPPPQGAPPPQQYQQYQQQYPTLGNTEPITNYYDIGEVLGKGAFSEVRDCRCKKTGNIYAVKIMKKDYNDKRTMDITYMELRVFKRIDKGPHCVHMIDMFESPNHYFLVMEKITGGELFQQITKLKKYSEKRASQLVEQMLLGIHHLWSVNIVHRDLKPENLLLSSKDEDADLLITDFGLSYIVQRSDEIMTHPVGTPGYVAPELVMCMDTQGRTGYSKAVDMWAVGVIIYIMLCGFPPFMGQDTNETFKKIKALSFSFPSPWWDEVSNSAKDLICHCLDPDPNRRYTPLDALNHPWIKDNKLLNDAHLAEGVTELKRFNAKRKLKGAMHAVRLAVRAQQSLGKSMDIAKAGGEEKKEEKKEESPA